MPRQPIIHARALRLYVNAGMTIPACQANARLLDTDATHWTIAPRDTQAAPTCKHCQPIARTR